MITMETILPLLTVLLTVLPGIHSQCDKLPDFLQKPSGDMTRLQQSYLILYGQDVTEKETCKGETEFCARRHIRFHVYCVLKSDGRPVADYVRIGMRKELEPCDASLIPYLVRNQEYVVMVKRVPGSAYPAVELEWDERTPSAPPAYYKANKNLVQTILTKTGMKPSPPEQATMDKCSGFDMSSDVTEPSPPRSWLRVDGHGMYRISLGIELTKEDARRECLSVGARLLHVHNEAELAELRKLLAAAKPDTMWWTSGLLVKGRYVWERQEYNDYGDHISVDLTMENQTLAGRHLVITKDGWSSVQNESATLPYICKLPVSGSKYSDFIPASFRPQRTVSVTYYQYRRSFRVCCRLVSFTTERVEMDSSNINSVRPFYVQSPPDVAVSFPEKDSPKMTLLMADVTDVSSPHVIWLVTDLDLQGNRTVLKYEDPARYINKERRLVLLTLAQPQGSMNVNPELYSDVNCTARPRCGFQIGFFISRLNLHLQNVMWVVTQPDSYAVHKLQQHKRMSEKDACAIKWTKHLTCPPRPSDGIRPVLLSYLYILVSVVIFVFK